MTVELRCEGNLYGVVSDDGKTIEVRCKRRKHGAYPGIIVLHDISLETGQPVGEPKKYRDPLYKNPSRKEG